jgi:hypothetical protein
MSEIEEYRKFVERLAELDSTEVFSNGQTDHARVIFETFFKFARKGVVIFCNKLSRNVYDQPSMISAANASLNRCIPIQILTQEQPEAQLFMKAAETWKENGRAIEIRTASPGSLSSKTPFNFAVMDGKGYRFEPAKGDHVAYACMNDVNLAQKLQNFFNQLHAQPVAL